MSQDIQEQDTLSEAIALFNTTKAVIADLCSSYKALTVKGPDDKEGMAVVRKARLHLAEIRIDGEKIRKAKVEKAVRWQKTVNAAAHELFDPIEPVESHLEYQEKTAERERVRLATEAAAKAEMDRKAKIDARMERLRAIGSIPASFAWLEGASDEVFDAEIVRLVAARDERDAAAKKVASERAEREAAEAIQRQQIEAAEREARKIESERLAQERAALDRQRKVDQEAADRRREQEQLERAELEALARAAQAKLDAERAVLEAERGRIEAEKLARRREEDAKAETARRAALASDSDKVRAYHDAVMAVPVPTVFCTNEIVEIVGAAMAEIRELLP